MSTWNDENSKISNRASYESLLKENRIIGLRLGSTFLYSDLWIILANLRAENEPEKKGERKSTEFNSNMRGNEYSINKILSTHSPHLPQLPF